MELYVAAFGFGLVSASVIAIAAVGFTMQFGITNMINLAYGEVMIVVRLRRLLREPGRASAIWIAMIAGALFGAVFSFLLNRFVYAPFQRKGTNLIGMVIVSLAVSLMIANILLPLVGYDTSSYEERTRRPAPHLDGHRPDDQPDRDHRARRRPDARRSTACCRYTRLGKAMRATAANPTLARNCGIPTQRVIDVGLADHRRAVRGGRRGRRP